VDPTACGTCTTTASPLNILIPALAHSCALVPPLGVTAPLHYLGCPRAPTRLCTAACCQRLHLAAMAVTGPLMLLRRPALRKGGSPPSPGAGAQRSGGRTAVRGGSAAPPPESMRHPPLTSTFITRFTHSSPSPLAVQPKTKDMLFSRALRAAAGHAHHDVKYVYKMVRPVMRKGPRFESRACDGGDLPLLTPLRPLQRPHDLLWRWKDSRGFRAEIACARPTPGAVQLPACLGGAGRPLPWRSSGCGGAVAAPTKPSRRLSQCRGS
jgi:hypothetical protein